MKKRRIFWGLKIFWILLFGRISEWISSLRCTKPSKLLATFSSSLKIRYLFVRFSIVVFNDGVQCCIYIMFEWISWIAHQASYWKRASEFIFLWKPQKPIRCYQDSIITLLLILSLLLLYIKCWWTNDFVLWTNRKYFFNDQWKEL